MAPVLFRWPAAERGYLTTAHRDRLPAVRIRAAVAASLADIDGGHLGMAEQLSAAFTGFHDCALIFFKASSMCSGINFLPDSSAFSCFCSLTICCAV